MSDLSGMPIDNGQRVFIASSIFTGTVGVCVDEQGGEFAFAGTMPVAPGQPGGIDAQAISIATRRRRGEQTSIRAIATFDPVTGTLDDRDIRIVALRPSTVIGGMLVARFQFQEAGR